MRKFVNLPGYRQSGTALKSSFRARRSRYEFSAASWDGGNSVHTCPMRAPTFDVSRLTAGLLARLCSVRGMARDHERRLAQMAVLNAISTVLLILAASQGLAEWGPVALTLGCGWLGLALFFLLVRSGWSKSRTDPTLSFEQLMFSIFVVVLSYGLIDIARGAALELLCLLLAFGMEQLSTRQLFKASTTAVAMLAVTSLARIALGGGTVRVDIEVYNLLMAAVLLPVAIIAGGEISRLYRRQAVQRGQLASTLGRLTELSVRDPLTGLTNRRRMLRMIEETHLEMAQCTTSYCVAMLDIDWFKRVNDGYGHAIGDVVLKDFAALVSSALDRRFTMARWGGEEFLVLLPCCTHLEAHAAISACRREVAAFDWSVRAPGLCITFSAGVAGSRQGDTTEDTLRRADQYLYLAKANGRNRTEVDIDNLPEAPAAAVAHAAMSHRAAANVKVASSVAGAAPQRQSEYSRATDFNADDRDGAGQLVTNWGRIADTVLSTQSDIRENLRLPLIACVLHAVWLVAVYFYAVPSGQIAAKAAWVVIVYELASAIGFYAAVRSGWSRRLSDGGLILAQMLAASAIASFGYVVAHELRPSLLHLLCVIQVFGMVTLKPAETRLAGAATIVLLCTIMICLFGMQPADLFAEILKLVLACTIVLQLSILSHGYSTVRKRVRDERHQLEDAVAQVKDQVTRDSLTGLLNRRCMEEALAEHHAAWLGGGENFCLGILDIDHFKRVNDEKGHHAGDSVLVAFAQASRQTLRESDLVCRWGGEEFVWLLRGSAGESASRATMQRLRLQFAQTMSGVAGIDWHVTFSSGFACPRDAVTIPELIAQADRALYRAKQSGRNRDMFAGYVECEDTKTIETTPA